MALYLVRRLAGTLALLVTVVAATFLLMSLAPGDVTIALVGEAGGGTEYLAQLRERLGIDQPTAVRLFAYLSNAIRGDLGFSAVHARPVVDVILDRFPATLLLAGTALLLATGVGVPLGVVAAARATSRLDATISVTSLVVYALPVFWVGQLLIGLVAVRLGWLPAGGMASIGTPGAGGAVDIARHLLLPATTLGLLLLGLTVRITRSSMIDVLGEPYIAVARSRGASRLVVLLRHALPNALRPVITVAAGQVGMVITGTVLIETVFSWPGLGRLLLDAILTRDTPLLLGLLLFSAVVVAVANLLADLAYVALDPRVQYR